MDFNKKLGLPDELGIGEVLAQEEQQTIKILVESRKWGKFVTVIEGFDKEIDLAALVKKLKSKVASGGTAKNNRIELQGNHAHTIKSFLSDMGFDENNIEITHVAKKFHRRR